MTEKQNRIQNWLFWIFIFGFIIYLTFGCKAPQSTTERFYSDTTIIQEKIKLVAVPGVSIKSNPINLDSLVAMIKAGIPPSVIKQITIRETDGNKVGILMDQFGNLTALCETKEQMIELMQKEITRLIQEKETTIIVKKRNFFQRVKDSLDLLVYTTLIILVVLFILKRFLP